MVSLHRGFGGQNLGLNPGKFKNADLHHGLRGFCGDLFTLEAPNMGRPKIAFIRENSNIAPNTKSFFASILFKRDVLKYRKHTLTVNKECHKNIITLNKIF